jgi:ureidoglycolate hydrolase
MESNTVPVVIKDVAAAQLAGLAGRIVLPSKAPDRSSVNANVWENYFSFNNAVTATFLQVKKRPFLLQRMERHVDTQEIVIALSEPVVVPVAPAGELAKNQADMVAICLPQGEGLILPPGTWHLAPFPLQATSNVLVVFKMGTPQNDMELWDLKPLVRMIWD